MGTFAFLKMAPGRIPHRRAEILHVVRLGEDRGRQGLRFVAAFWRFPHGERDLPGRFVSR